ncbi:LytTR family DNA-binding domain-containing protein [Maricaulis sp. W15]|uniref:LytTR family DNA-binding domain-containing protein n=1 Tax=Maricaulis sp. W15 TaxID=1772333 RepID=UPI000AC54FE9|nr:LytTR family DNA-binding domain-containing protein [Maricaulis sp. W15]
MTSWRDNSNRVLRPVLWFAGLTIVVAESTLNAGPLAGAAPLLTYMFWIGILGLAVGATFTSIAVFDGLARRAVIHPLVHGAGVALLTIVIFAPFAEILDIVFGIQYRPLVSTGDSWERLTGFAAATLNEAQAAGLRLAVLTAAILDLRRLSRGQAITSRTGSLPEESEPMPLEAREDADASAPSSDVAASDPGRFSAGFFNRLDESCRGELWAIQAEHHHILVTTDAGRARLRYRFSDALQDVAAIDGAAVHRSHWVSRCGVQTVIRRGRQLEIVLKDRSRIPVSRSNREIALSLLNKDNAA